MKKEKQNKIVRIGSLKEFQAVIDQPISCRIRLGEKVVEVPVHRLSPAQHDLVEVERKRPVPPKIAPKKPGEEEYYDREAPAFLKEQEKAERIARAMTVYFGCPWLSEENPHLTNGEAILEYVQGGNGKNGVLTNVVLEILYMTILGEGIAVDNQRAMEKANFTTAPE